MPSPPPSRPLPYPFSASTTPPTLITQGAEAHLYHTTYLSPDTPAALKYRPPKPYRHPVLDARLSRHRLLSEARTLVRCRRGGVSVPGVLGLDAEGGWMLMEWIQGRTVRDLLVGLKRGVGVEGGRGASGEEEEEEEEEKEKECLKGLMGKIGRAVGKMHAVGVVHGDLTTSNMMLRPRRRRGKKIEGGENGGREDVDVDGVEMNGLPPPLRQDVRDEVEGGEIMLIDFGLSGQSIQDEDRAVDLYVLERAFGSTHPEAEEDFQEVLRVYGEAYQGAKIVLKRLEEVRMRGRKKSMIG